MVQQAKKKKKQNHLQQRRIEKYFLLFLCSSCVWFCEEGNNRDSLKWLKK
uniref:Uncharacterized protein n=1 Tax=Rhizophora mucronata TaxID=61149 RepID=A0A2P2KW53_RHIMU